ncbi:hypothetical protein BDV24DRAFT_162302 [Aspergillus arachidicola]|uniref:Uncharacterized protein n=1 Tax=Aspergillus arachidicola TaxID=656916 RepID=A0A5N6YAA4_9EURO|nr:hypothetical protein BDV24DRAFT_162302 [Aspergillus arachidicola]
MENTRTIKTMLLLEEMKSKSFVLRDKDLDTAGIESLTFHTILSVVGRGQDSPEDYSFFLDSESMKAAVQLLTDRSIYLTYRIYCEKDHSITIIIRPASDPSPNSSQCPSAPESLRQRRKVSGKKNLQNVFVRSTVKTDTRNLDAETLSPIMDFPETERVVLDLGNGQYETFSVSYLLGWIMAEAEKGTPLHNIVVTSITLKGRPSDVKLSKDVWTRSLLRGPHKGKFLQIWGTYSETSVGRTDALDSLVSEFDYFSNNAKVFIRDLKLFGTKPESRTRPLSTHHRLFLGEPYFSNTLVGKILTLPLQPSTLQGHLDNLMKKKAERGQSDDAPIMTWPQFFFAPFP